MSTVSIVIPNYNAREYIDECVESIKKNKSDLEIIIIDDGSKDSSKEKLEELEKSDSRIMVKYQANMNASVARNVGMSMATGKYILFVDADDRVESGAIDLMVNEMEKEGVDLVIGNHIFIDQKGQFISKSDDFVEKKYIEVSPMNLVNRVPNPTNKLYRMDIIRKYNITWGNVRIGQDINFYLKYLSACQRVDVINNIICHWRILSNSMSHEPSLRILDIVNSFEDVRSYYFEVGSESLYIDYVRCVEFEHFNRQMEKQKYFQDRNTRKFIVSYFSYFLKNMMKQNLKTSSNFLEYRRRYTTCKLKLALKCIYTSQIYKDIMKNR